MNKEQAILLYKYIRRGIETTPTTGAEWNGLQAPLSMIEAAANGLITIDVKPADTALQKADETVEQPTG